MAVRPEDLAEALMARRREAAARSRTRATALRRALDDVIAEALGDKTITRAWLIGSLARGDFGAASDVDVVVEGLAEDAFARLWGTLGERLQADVDLLRLEALAPSFRDRVLQEGLPLVG